MNSLLLIFMVVPLGLYLIILIMATVTMELPGDTDDTDEAVATDTFLTDAAPALEFESAFPTVLESAAPLAVTSAVDAEMAAPSPLETAHAETNALAAESSLVADNLADRNPLPTETVAAQSEPVVAAKPEAILPESAPTVTIESDAEPEAPSPEPIGPIEFPAKGSPKYAFDYRGRLWVEKKRKSFFRQLRRPQIPPEEPQ